MKLYIIDYWDFDKPNYYIVVAKDAEAALKKAEKKYQKDNDISDDFMVNDVFELTEWEGYKISLTRKRFQEAGWFWQSVSLSVGNSRILVTANCPHQEPQPFRFLNEISSLASLEAA